MARYFTSAMDIVEWVRNHKDAETAANTLIKAVGDNKHESDILESTRRIFAQENSVASARILFKVLAEYNITEDNMKSETQPSNDGQKTAEPIVKAAQVMRQPGQYPMEMRVCPKLPKSVGGRLISTYNCRHYCLDSMVLDEQPDKVYCMEAVWRGHVMDKFSSDWKDPKTGEMVGGYINNRFFKFPDAGTPSNPDVPRDGGNNIQLDIGERSKQPRPHEYSMERRLSEQREKNSTESIILAKNGSPIKVAAEELHLKDKSNVHLVFSFLVDSVNSGMNGEDAVIAASHKFAETIPTVAVIYQQAMRKLAMHRAKTYSVKLANAQRFIVNSDIPVIDQNAKNTTLPHGTHVVLKDPVSGLYAVLNENEQEAGFVKIDQAHVGALGDFSQIAAASAEVGLTDGSQTSNQATSQTQDAGQSGQVQQQAEQVTAGQSSPLKKSAMQQTSPLGVYLSYIEQFGGDRREAAKQTLSVLTNGTFGVSGEVDIEKAVSDFQNKMDTKLTGMTAQQVAQEKASAELPKKTAAITAAVIKSQIESSSYQDIVSKVNGTTKWRTTR